MKFSRRAFLQFTAGVVGGTLFTPIPWKLADDSAIWTQNWSWRPSPERGHIEKQASTCVLCDGGCGIQARLVENKRAILLEGNPDNPVSNGGICALGAAGLQFLYAPYRISQPMKRTLHKGGPHSGFQPISWDEALGELTEQLKALRSVGNAHRVACITEHRRSSMDDLWQQFMTSYGSPNFFKMPSHEDSLRLAASLTTGHERPLAFGIENASYILSFGAGLAEGWSSPARCQTTFAGMVREKSEAGSTKLVQIEDRCSITASKADSWVPIAPGTEPLLALGIAHVLIKENLYDTDFAGRHVFGLDDWTDTKGKTHQGFKNLVLAQYSPEQIAERTGLEAGRIGELAREFGGQKSAIAVWGNNQGNLPENIYHDLCFMALNVLKGNLRPDGTVSLVPDVPLGSLPRFEIDESAKKSLAQKRVDLARRGGAPLPGSGLYSFLDAVANSSSYSLDLLLVYEANPAYALPDGKVFESAREKIGYMVSFSSYMDETAQQANLILPNHTAFERFDDVIGLPYTRYGYYAVASPILKPQLLTKHTGDTVLEVAGRLGENVAAALPWKSYQEYLQDRVKGLAELGRGAVADGPDAKPWDLKPGESVKANYKDGTDLWKKLKSGYCWYDAPSGTIQDIKTLSGKLEIACQQLLEKGLAVDDDQVYLPHFAPLTPSGSESDFPLLLVSYQVSSISSNYLPNPPFMTKTIPDTILKHNDSFVEVNPLTARSVGIGEGERVKLQTPQGEIPVLVHLTQRARAGVIYIVHGLGHKAYDQYIQNKGANANNVIEVQMDPVTGLGTVWSTRAQLRRA